MPSCGPAVSAVHAFPIECWKQTSKWVCWGQPYRTHSSFFSRKDLAWGSRCRQNGGNSWRAATLGWLTMSGLAPEAGPEAAPAALAQSQGHCLLHSVPPTLTLFSILASSECIRLDLNPPGNKSGNCTSAFRPFPEEDTAKAVCHRHAESSIRPVGLGCPNAV